MWSRAALTIFGATTIGVIGASIFSKSRPYAAQYHFHDPRWAGGAKAALATGRIIALPFWYVMGRRMGARCASSMAYAIFGIVALFVYAVAILQWPTSFGLAFVGAAMSGITLFACFSPQNLPTRLGRSNRIPSSPKYSVSLPV